MPKINLANGKPIPSFSSEELDELLSRDISDTKKNDISATKISDTKISATKYMNNYKREHYDTLRIDLAKGRKEILKQEATKRNISVTKLINDAIEHYLENK